MKITILLIPLLIFSLFTQSCGPKKNTASNRKNNPSRGTFDLSDFEVNVSLRNSFSFILQKAKPDPDGHFKLLGNKSESPQTPAQYFLEKRNAKGDILWSKNFTDVDEWGDLVHHPSSEMSLVSFKGDTLLEMNLLKLTPQGEVISKTPFSSLVQGHCNKPLFADDSTTDIVDIGNGLILSAFACQKIFIMRLDENHRLVWKRFIDYGNADHSFYRNVSLSIDEQNNIYLLTGLSPKIILHLNRTLGASPLAGTGADGEEEDKGPLKSKGGDDYLLSKWSETGERTWLRILGSELDDYGGKIVTNGIDLFLSTVTQVNKAKKEDEKPRWEGDLTVQKIEVDSGEQVWSRRFDVQGEDFFFDLCLTRKSIFLVGTTGFVVAETGSMVQYGEAFILGLDHKGIQNFRKVFGFPRHDALFSVAALTENKLFVAGTFDGPKTHDGDKDKFQLFSHGEIFTLPFK